MDTRRMPRELALDLYKRSHCSVQVAAVLSDRRGIFAWGWNCTGRVRGIHAEEQALKRANPKRVAGSTLIIVGRRRKSGAFVYARPCEQMCMLLVRKRKIACVEFLTPCGDWEVMKF